MWRRIEADPNQDDFEVFFIQGEVFLPIAYVNPYRVEEVDSSFEYTILVLKIVENNSEESLWAKF